MTPTRTLAVAGRSFSGQVQETAGGPTAGAAPRATPAPEPSGRADTSAAPGEGTSPTAPGAGDGVSGCALPHLDVRIGDAAGRIPAQEPTFELSPGTSARARLRVVEASSVPRARCVPVEAQHVS